MRCVNPGHVYELDCLDRPGTTTINFVKRIGANYPGNTEAFPGPISQEYLRALIDRSKYVDKQKPSWENKVVLRLLRTCIWLLEHRAFRVHGERLPSFLLRRKIELIYTCTKCGHIVGHTWHG